MIFAQEPPPDTPRLMPVYDTLEKLLSNSEVKYLVVDLNSSTGAGLQTLDEVSRSRPGMRQIVIGPDDDEKVMEAIIAGARAYLYPSAAPETVRMALDVVVSGSIWAPRRLLSKLIDRLLQLPGKHAKASVMQLTARELQVLGKILLARSNKEIANELGIEERTVKAHVGRLLRKTGAENRTELSMLALNHSLVPGESQSSPGPIDK
jgi:DNA-binding NarL/FixJ family response regulator